MRVVVAMSGGVDSSAAAALLRDQGHEVIGITLKVWASDAKASCGSCCSPSDIDDARAVADRLGIPFYVADVQELFREKVVDPFVQAYLQGRTPIPCVACNDEVKFGFLLHRARQLGAALATGHYARVEGGPGAYRLLRAVDEAKDQSYFLFGLGQDELKDLRFPVGSMTKAEVREVARAHGLTTSAKPESMEICFVPDGDYAAFVEKLAGPQPEGEIVTAAGESLGRHQGVHRFTVGQRKGLKLSARAPLYVQRLEAGEGRVVVGPRSELDRTSFQLRGARWVEGAAPLARELTVKIRHRHPGARARLVEAGPGALTVELAAPLAAVTPGQAAVLYDQERVLGGGWIA